MGRCSRPIGWCATCATWWGRRARRWGVASWSRRAGTGTSSWRSCGGSWPRRGGWRVGVPTRRVSGVWPSRPSPPFMASTSCRTTWRPAVCVCSRFGGTILARAYATTRTRRIATRSSGRLGAQHRLGRHASPRWHGTPRALRLHRMAMGTPAA